MRKRSSPLVVPSVTDEDPMTSKRVIRQPKKKNPVTAALGKLRPSKKRTR